MLEEKDLLAIAQLMDQKLEPINTRLDKMDSRLDHLEQSLTEAKTLATKTQLLLENDIAKKVNSLYEDYELHNKKIDDIESNRPTNAIVIE